MSDDVDRSRELLGKAQLNNLSQRYLAAAQVHATLAVEVAVRELIARIGESQAYPRADDRA